MPGGAGQHGSGPADLPAGQVALTPKACYSAVVVAVALAAVVIATADRNYSESSSAASAFAVAARLGSRSLLDFGHSVVFAAAAGFGCSGLQIR